MNTDIKKRWIDALNSGDYKQGQHGLNIGDEFCCLGVLCDLAAADGVVTVVYEPQFRYVRSYQSFDGETKYLPPAVQSWAGLDNRNPAVAVDHDRSLASLNDDGYTFEAIALVIEAAL